MTLNEPTIITLKNGHGRYEIEVNHTDITLYEMLELVERLLRAAGYACGELTEEPEDAVD